MEAALEALAIELDAIGVAPAGVAAPRRPALPSGPIAPPAIASILGAMLPDNAIVIDESIDTGREFFPETAGAPPHDWINNRGGSIGYATPVAVGPPSPARPQGRSRSSATAAPCTRCSRCGPWRARASPSPR